MKPDALPLVMTTPLMFASALIVAMALARSVVKSALMTFID